MDNGDYIQKQIDELKGNYKDLESRVIKVETSKETTEFQYKEIMKALDKLNDITIPKLAEEIEKIKSKPAKKRESVINAAITGFVALLVSFAFNKFSS